MTVSQIAEEAANEVGEQYSDADVAYRFQRWVADCAAELFGMNEWPFLRSSFVGATVAAQANYEFTDDVAGTVESVQYGSGDSAIRLEGTTRDRLLALGINLAQAGTPTHWYVNGVDATGGIRIAMWPVPDAVSAFTAWLTQPDPVLDTAASTLLMPRDVLRTIRYCVVLRYHEQSDDSSDKTVAAARERYSLALTGLLDRYINNAGVNREIRFTRATNDPIFMPLREPRYIG